MGAAPRVNGVSLIFLLVAANKPVTDRVAVVPPAEVVVGGGLSLVPRCAQGCLGWDVSAFAKPPSSEPACGGVAYTTVQRSALPRDEREIVHRGVQRVHSAIVVGGDCIDNNMIS